MNLREWLGFAIENQEQLKQEHKDTKFPQWNVGYLEALMDMRKVIDEQHAPIMSVAQLDMNDK